MRGRKFLFLGLIFCFQTVLSQAKNQVKSHVYEGKYTFIDAQGWESSLGLLSFARQSNVSFLYKNPYVLPNIRHLHLGVLLSSKYGNFIVQSRHRGSDLLGNFLLSLSYSRSFLKKVGFGVSMDYWFFYVQNIAKKHVPSLQLSIAYKPHPLVLIGAQVKNPVPTKRYTDMYDVLPFELCFNLRYKPTRKVYIAWQYVQDIRYSPTVRLDVKYHPISYVGFSTGAQIFPYAIHLGAYLAYKKVLVQFISSYHFRLGYTPELSMSYAFNTFQNK